MPSLTHVRALVVDDDADAREVTAAILSAAGATVALAMSSGEALSVAANAMFDVMLVDIAMPDVDGYELLEQLRRTGSTDVPVVAVSAYAGQEHRSAALKAGFAAFHTKPVDALALARAVSHLVTPHQTD